MLYVGQKEIDAVVKQLKSGEIFRYHDGGQCERFEKRYAKSLGGKYLQMCASGTNALVAALASLDIGPGDEVIVPAHTYMATAVAVLQVGAIPVIVDIDESITMDPAALEDAIGPRTKAVIPVHMWGVVCDMRRIMRVARKYKLRVVEDCCQCIGGAYEGKMVGTLGDAGAYSFNYFKNMTCGEGGAVLSKRSASHDKVRCLIDCCSFYWTGRKKFFEPFTSNGARASEIQGAMMNAQLDRLPGLIRNLRAQKKKLVKETTNTGLHISKINSLDWECGTMMMYLLPTVKQADTFAEKAGCGIAGKTGRHTYNEWDPILQKRGHVNPKLDAFKNPANKGCRMKYSKKMLPRSLDILNRTAQIGLSPLSKASDVKATIRRIKDAAKDVLVVAAR